MDHEPHTTMDADAICHPSPTFTYQGSHVVQRLVSFGDRHGSASVAEVFLKTEQKVLRLAQARNACQLAALEQLYQDQSVSSDNADRLSRDQRY